jgi:uncharacterized membrane protein YbhN (UPF0104 family)
MLPSAETFKKLTPYISLTLFLGAAYAVQHQISGYGWQNVWEYLVATPADTLVVMLFMTLFSYFTLSLCEWVAIKYAQEKLDSLRFFFK